MKLCQKCQKQIEDEIFLYDMRSPYYPKGEPIPEPDCEFWAHKELNFETTGRYNVNLKELEKLGVKPKE